MITSIEENSIVSEHDQIALSGEYSRLFAFPSWVEWKYSEWKPICQL